MTSPNDQAEAEYRLEHGHETQGGECKFCCGQHVPGQVGTYCREAAEEYRRASGLVESLGLEVPASCLYQTCEHWEH